MILQIGEVQRGKLWRKSREKAEPVLVGLRGKAPILEERTLNAPYKRSVVVYKCALSKLRGDKQSLPQNPKQVKLHVKLY